MTTNDRSLPVTVSGSFHRHIDEVQEAVRTFRELGHRVLSPADPRIVDEFGEFLFVASDELRSIQGIQSRHLASISKSALLWLVCPDGYVGTSAAAEVGFAISESCRVFSRTPPSDLTIRQYVEIAGSPDEAVTRVTQPEASSEDAPHLTLLIDPPDAIASAHTHLEILHRSFLRSPQNIAYQDIARSVAKIQGLLELP